MRYLLTVLIVAITLCAVSAESKQVSSEILSVSGSSGANEAASGQAVIAMDRNRTKSDIIQMAKRLAHSGFTYGKTTQYADVPELAAPYKAGALTAEDIADALNAIKMIRFIAGLPYESVQMDTQLNNISQHGAVLLAATGQFTHSPEKTEEMSLDFFSLAAKGCSSANLYKGTSNASSAVIGFMADPGDGNIAAAAHRRWILRPSTVKFGLGYAEKITSLYVLDSSGAPAAEADTYIAWPNCGDFPIEYFIGSEDISTTPKYPWSVNLGAAYGVPDRENITITLTRTRDNKVWYFDKNTPQLGVGNLPDSSMHLAVDNIGYGIGKAIIFRPDVTSLGAIFDGDEFIVCIGGLQGSSGTETELNYTIRFFSLKAELEKQSNCQENNPAHSAARFSDVCGHWSEENIEFVTERGLFRGTDETTFSPDGTMTRAMLVTVLARLSGADIAYNKGKTAFEDVDDYSWYADSVMWAYENGLVNGTGNNSFSPDAPVTREQTAVLLMRYTEVVGSSLNFINSKNIYSDDWAISPWSVGAIYSLQRAGIVEGKPGNTFDPLGFSTRAEICAVLKRFILAAVS